MAPVAKLISRAAGRYLGGAGRTIGRELLREAEHRYRARARQPAGPAPPTAPVGPLAGAVYVAWLGGLAAFALVLLNVDLFLPAAGVAAFRLAIGGILLVLGSALLPGRLGARRLLLARLAARAHSRGRGIRAGWRRLVGAGLTLLGILWVATGVLELLRGGLALG